VNISEDTSRLSWLNLRGELTEDLSGFYFIFHAKGLNIYGILSEVEIVLSSLTQFFQYKSARR